MDLVGVEGPRGRCLLLFSASLLLLDVLALRCPLVLKPRLPLPRPFPILILVKLHHLLPPHLSLRELLRVLITSCKRTLSSSKKTKAPSTRVTPGSSSVSSAGRPHTLLTSSLLKAPLETPYHPYPAPTHAMRMLIRQLRSVLPPTSLLKV